MGVGVAGQGKYNHKEAFCLMQYYCSKCHLVELLWNSRDGVTPFMVSCSGCDSTMQHVRWEQDRCMPEYKPKKGQRVFIDLTREKYIADNKEYIAKLFAENVHDIRSEYANEEEALESFTKDFDESNGEPDILVWEG